MIFTVDNYQIDHYSDKKSIYLAVIALNSADRQYSSTLYIVRDQGEIRNPTFTGGGKHSTGYFQADFLPIIVDVLRNEGPVYCGNYYPSSNPYIAFSTDPEEVGEGEN